MSEGINGSELILIVEDSDADYYATLRAFKKDKLKNPTFRCEDGDLALDYILGRNKFQDREKYPLPGVILLDLNLPSISGYDVLSELKSTPIYNTIPIIVLTTSSDPRDIEFCYQHGANSFIVKPVDTQKFVQAMSMLVEYWFKVVVIPGSKDMGELNEKNGEP